MEEEITKFSFMEGTPRLYGSDDTHCKGLCPPLLGIIPWHPPLHI